MKARWWDGGEKKGPTEQEQAQGLSSGLRAGMGIGFVTIAEGTIYPFMLSSAFTARNFGTQDREEIEMDLLWAFLLSVVTGGLIAYFLKSGITFVYAILLGGVLSLIYLVRGGFIRLPVHVPLVSPKPHRGD